MTQQNWYERLLHWWYVKTGQETAAQGTVTDNHIGGAGPAIKVLLLVAVSVSLLECAALYRVGRFVRSKPNSETKTAFIERARQFRDAARSHYTSQRPDLLGSSRLEFHYDSAKSTCSLLTADEKTDATAIVYWMLGTKSAAMIHEGSIEIYFGERDSQRFDTRLNDIAKAKADAQESVDVLNQAIYAYECNKSVLDILNQATAKTKAQKAGGK